MISAATGPAPGVCAAARSCAASIAGKDMRTGVDVFGFESVEVVYEKKKKKGRFGCMFRRFFLKGEIFFFSRINKI